MNTQFESRCDCCGLLSNPAYGDDCPRCGYPIAVEKEKYFLKENIQNLQRVAKHGGTFLTVAALLARYQHRLNFLLQQRAQIATQPIAPFVPTEPLRNSANTLSTNESYNNYVNSLSTIKNPQALPSVDPVKLSEKPEIVRRPVKLQAPAQPLSPVSSEGGALPVVPPKPARTFSFKTFFADQTINIVSLLGAFLILIGSLSFVVTTPDFGLAFFTLLVVHALFGIMGAVTHRFKSFRIVSVIYTVIFALQVPLVGLAGYRLVSGASMQFSPSGLVAIAAMYAAIIYSALAISQRFQPFAYLAAASILVVDIALAITFHLGYWWWPSTLMLLALASLVFVSPATRDVPASQKSWHILFQPVKFLMIGYVGLSYLSVLLAWTLSLSTGPNAIPFTGSRFSFVCTLLLLLCWTCLFAWRSRVSKWLIGVPYLLLACVLAFAYACSFSASGYVIALTGMAFFYYGIEHFAHKQVQGIPNLRTHLEVLILALVSMIPFIVDGALPIEVFAKAYGFSSVSIIFSSKTIVGTVALLCCAVLTINVIIGHTGRQKSPSQAAGPWCWLLLLSGLLFDWSYNLIALMLNVNPLWSALAFTCMLLLTTIYTRRFMSAAWTNPLDILALGFVAQTLLLAIPQGHSVLLTLLFAFAGISYVMGLYQRHIPKLVAAFVFAFLACIPLSDIGQVGSTQGATPTVLLLLSLLLPLTWAILERSLRSYGNRYVLVGSLWTLPVLLIGLIYTLEFLSIEASHSFSMYVPWLQILLSSELELVLLACIWYSAAVIARKKVGLIVATCLVCWVLLFPTNTFFVLAGVAFVSILLAVPVSRFAGSVWAAPFYIVGLLAALLTALSHDSYYYMLILTFISFFLLVFGVLLYLVGIVERMPRLAVALRWLAVVFVAWALYDAGLLGQYSWAPITAIVGAGIGVGIRMMAPLPMSKNKLWSYAAPLYTISLVSALLMGLDGLLLGITRPFYGAIPDALLAYAVIVYGVLLLEKYQQGLLLVAGFAIWGLFLMVQMSIAHCIVVGCAMGLIGVCCGRFVKLHSGQSVVDNLFGNMQWSWPWYLAFVLAALLTGSWNLFAMNKADAVLLENGLLAFVLLSYIIIVVEGMPLWLGWISVGLACWSFIEAALYADLRRLFFIVVLCTFAGALTRLVKPIIPSSYQQQWQRRRFDIARPLYTMALVAAVLSGFPLSILNVNAPFYAAVPCALMVYGLLAYGVAVWERRPWLWISAGFIIWGVCLLPQAASCQLQSSIQIVRSCYEQSRTIPLTTVLLVGVTLISCLLGLGIGRLPGSSQVSAQGLSSTQLLRTCFRWNWSWYSIAQASLIVTLLWCVTMSSVLPAHILTVVLALFLGLVLVVMIVERLPDLSLLAIGLAVWLIAQTQWVAWQVVCAYSVLCLFIFAGQFLWKYLLPVVEIVSATILARVASLFGFSIVILAVIVQGGLSSQAIHAQALFLFAQSGIFAVCLGAILLCWLAKLLPTSENIVARFVCYYGAGFLLSLAVSWELLCFGQTDVAWLTLAPASYMIVTAPFLLHSKHLTYLRWLGHSLALCGAMLLLVPTLWSSFANVQVLPTLLLFAEALFLFLLGASVRMRFFVLSGAGLVVVSAIHLLFLPELGIPTFLALTLSGMVLLAIATGLLIIRTRIAAVWNELE